MAEDSTINIQSTSYNIEDKWLEVAKKYYNIDDNDENGINLLKSGLFGYNNEIMSNEIKNNVFHRNFLYNEHFLNTANIPESIYNFAKIQNYEISNAIPAHLRINFAVSKTDIENSSDFKKINDTSLYADSDSVFEFIIDNNYVFNVGDFKFLLPYPVQLLFKKNNIDNDFAVTARYLYNDNNFSFFNKENPYIKLWEESHETEKFLFLALDIFQMDSKENAIEVTSEDISENLFYDFSYTNQLVYFNVYYDYNGETFLLNKYFNNTFTPSNDEKFCYYSYINDNEIEISFSALPNNFRPRTNSVLRIEIFTSEGSSGNFTFNGKITTNYIEDGSMSKIPVYITPIEDSSGGTDKPTYIDIKNELINNSLVRNNLIMESDLDTYFNQISDNNKIFNSKITFIKKRNDLIKRLYSAFILLRDNQNKILPTNTISSLKLSETELITNNYTLPENTTIVYDIQNNSYFIVYHELELDDYKDTSKYLLYSIPYLIKINKSPILSAIYYKTYIDNDLTLNFNYINSNIPYKFLFTNTTVKRNNLNKNVPYTFQITLNSNISNDEYANVKVRGILRSNVGEIYGYFDFKKINDISNIYEGYLAVDVDNPIQDNYMNIYNSLYDINTSPIMDNNGFTSVKNCYISSKVQLEIQVLYKNKYNTDKYGVSNLMPDVTDYGCACSLSLDSDLELFTNMSNMIESTIYPNTDGSLNLKSIPLIEKNYFENNSTFVYRLLENFIDLISNNINRLENNTNIDIKFYNTYGPSKWYYTSKELVNNSYKYNMLPRIDMNIDLNICVNGVVTTEFDNSIKEYISNFVESCNEDKIFPISNLIRKLEENFDAIRYIEFNSIDKLPVQKVENKFTSFYDMSTNEIIDFVPEYLNLRKNLVISNNEISVEQYYNYSITINYI